MNHQKEIKKLIKKNIQKYLKKFTKNRSKIILMDSRIEDFSNNKSDSYMIYENQSEFIMKVNIKLNKNSVDEEDDQKRIYAFNKFLKDAPDKILDFLNIELSSDDDRTIGFR